MTNQTNKNSKKSSVIGKRILAFLLAFAMILQPTLSSVGSIVYAEETTEAGAAVSEPQGGTEVQQPAAEPTQPAVEPTQPAVEPSEPAPADDGSGQAASDADAQNQPESDQQAVDPDEKKDETKEDEEEKFPAQSFKGSVSGLVVNVSAPEGALPEETQMKVSEVNKDKVIQAVERDVNIDVEKVRAADITFYDKEGNPIEPKVPVSVSMSASGMDTSAEKTVVHIDDNWKAEKVNSASVTQKGVAKFATNEFSIYAIVDEGTDARLLVKFVKPDGSLIDSMYVKKNDDMEVVLYDPGAGELSDGVYFRGWTTNEAYTPETDALSIEEVRTEVSGMLPPTQGDGQVVTYYAMLFKDYRITYLDENEISLGQEEVTFRADAASAEQSYKVNMGYTVQDDTHHFEGWNVVEGGSNIAGYTEGKTYENNDIITITGDVTFGVDAPEGHWFIFDENGKGATYNAPQFIQSGQHPTRPDDANMIRNGYTFGGWFADKAVADQTSGGTQYDFSQPLTDKTTVYARWISKTTAPYTIIIWKQNLAGDGYDFVESVSKTGNVGSVINTVRYQNNNLQIQRNGNQWSTVSYTGFHYKEYDQNVTIMTEGNSVLNVYFDRNQHTLQFQVQGYTYTPTTNNDGTQYGLVNGEYVQLTRHNQGSWINPRYYWTYGNNIRYNGTRYTRSYGWTSIKEITALYGQSISDQFPIVGTNGETYTAGRWDPQSSTPYSEVLSYIDIMPNADVTFHLDNGGPGPGNYKTIYYYTEALPGETGPTVTYKGKTFTLYKELQCNYNFFTESEDYIDLVGFDKYGVDPETGAWGSGGASTVKCYYTRKTYTINFMDGKYVNGDGNPMTEAGTGQIFTEEGIAYGADISSYNSYEPENTPSGYVFEGWYLDDACTQPYTFGTMPEGGITVYAKWRQKQYRVFLHVNYPEGATGNINWGTTNQQFAFRISEGGHVSEPTGRDLAGFEFVGWYLDEACTQVFNGEAYTINESNVTTPYNKSVDMTDTYDNNGNLIDPKSNSDATGYNGGDRFWITTKLDIYAKWRSTLEGASGIVVEYDANDGTGAPTDTHTYVDGAKAPAGAASKSNDSSKVFSHWVVQKWNGSAWTDTTTTVLPGKTFTVLAANAKVEDITPTPATGDTKKYTVRLKAEYADSEEPTPTHIYWYKNDNTDAYIKNNNAVINVGVDIPSAPTLDGYEFLGWARVNIGNTQEAASAWEQNSANWTQNLTASNLYLYYKNDGTYHLNSTSGTAVTQVAPDENTPYHAMFAVWQPKLSVKITGNSGELPYNGSEQSVTGYTVQYKLGDGEWSDTAPEGVSVALAEGKTAEAKGTDIGTYPMGLAKDDFTVDAAGYAFDPDTDLEIVDGQLKITKISVTVTITGNKDSKTYNGSEQSVDGYEVEISNPLYTEDDFTFSGDDVAKGTTVGTYPMGLAESQFTNNNDNFDVTFEVTDGELEITKLAVTVTITGKEDSKVYTGREQRIEGYKTEISSELYTTADFTFSGEAVAVGTNVGTYPMGLTEDQFTNDNDNFDVTFEVTDGELEITKKAVTVTITGNKDSLVYNGEEQKVEGYEVEISDSLYTEADFTFSGEDVAKGTDVDTYPMGLTEDQFTNDNDNFDVTFEVTDGELEITKKTVTVTITGNTDSKVYNREEQKVEGYEVEISDPLYTEDDFTFSGEAVAAGTDVGTYPMGLAEDQFTNDNDNFNVTFTVTDGQLVITKADLVVKITGNTDTKTYNGEEQKVEGYEVEIPSGADFTKDDIQFSGEDVATGTDVGTYEMGLAKEQFSVESNNFTVEFQVIDGQLKINPLAVTVTIAGNTDGKVYNGEEQKVEGYEVEISDPLYTEEDFTFSGDDVAKGTTVGTYPMGLAESQFTNNNDNFTVTFSVTDGELKITKRPVVVDIEGTRDSKVYNGEEQKVEGYEVEISDDLYTEADFTFSGDATAKGTAVGVYPMQLTSSQFQNNDDNFDVTFNIVKDGQLEITKKAVTVTITGNKDSLVYNGEEQKVEGYEVEISDSLYTEADFTFSGEDVAKGTDVDTYPMGLTEDQFTNDNDNFDVTFEVTDGELEITKKTVTVTITGNTDSKVYNREEQKVEGYEVEISDPLYTEDDFTFSGEAVAAGTDVGTYPMGLAEDQFTNDNDNFDVTFEVTDGELKITKLEVTVTITGNTNSLVYNGEEQKVEGYEVEISDPLYTESDFTFSGEAVATGTDVDTYEMGLAEDQFTNKNDNYDVTFEVTDGELEITKLAVTITITGNKDSLVYNGEEQKIEGYEVEISDSLYTEDDFTFSGEDVAKGTDVGTYPMGFTEDQFTNDNDNFDVTFEVTDGELEITKKTVTVTITGNKDSLVYNGEEQKIEGYEVEISDSLYTEADFTFSGEDVAKGTDVDTYPMGLTEDQFTNDNDNFDVTFEVTDGELEITKKAVTVTITGNKDSLVYNGEEQKVEGYEVEISDSLYTEADFTFSGEDVAKGTDVDTYPMGLTEDQFTNDNDNFDVTFEVTDGELEITKKTVTVTITGNTDSKVYNREEQKVEGYEVEISDPLYTEDDFTFSGEAVAAGTDVGTYPMGLAEDQFTNDNDNFNVTFTVTDGQLVITKADLVVKITGNTDTKTYNGEEQKVEGYEVEIPSGADFTKDDIQFSGEDVATGTDVGTYEMGLAKEQFSVESNNFTVEFQVIDGQLKINPLAVTVTIAGNTDGKVYNGEEQKVEGYEVEISDPLYTEEDFTFSGDDVAKGTTVGTYPMGLAESQFTNNNDNFTVTFSVTDGELEINPLAVTVTITGNTDTKVYNSQEQKVEGYEVKISDPLYTEADFTFSGEDVAKGTDVDTYPMGLAEDQFTNNNDNFTVTFSVTDGELEIAPLAVTVTITGNTDSKVYNETEQKVEGYEVEISDPLYTEDDFTFSGEAVAVGTDVGTYQMGLAEDQFANNSDNFDVTFDVTDGSLTITPIKVTLTSNSDTLTYDGNSHTVTGFTSSVEGLTFEGVSASGGGKNAGTYDIEFSGVTVGKTTDATGNYVVDEIVTGSLTINRKAVTVTADDLSKVAGTMDPTLTATPVGLVGSDQIVFTITREPGSTPGTYRIIVTGEEIQGNYIITYNSGIFTITPAPTPTPPTPTPPRVTPTVTPAATVTTPVATPTLTPPEVIENDPTPQATIDDGKAPKAEPETFWALINLLCAIATCLISVLLLAFYFIKRKADEDEQKENSNSRASFMDDQEEAKRHNKLGMRLLGLIPAIGSVVAFILTEDMSAKMQMVDKWTLMMVIILAIEVAVAVFSKKTTDDGEEEQGQPAKA